MATLILRRMFRLLVVTCVLAVIAIILAALALVRGPGVRAISYVRAVAVPAGAYLPDTIIIGPDSTEFMMIDEARPPVVRYICAFTAPQYVKTNPGGTRLYVPAVQCNTEPPG